MVKLKSKFDEHKPEHSSAICFHYPILCSLTEDYILLILLLLLHQFLVTCEPTLHAHVSSPATLLVAPLNPIRTVFMPS